MGLPKIDRIFPVSAASGLLLALSFPRLDWWWLAWVALVPLFLVFRRRPFAAGFTAGTIFFAVVLYWLNIVMTTYGQMHPLFSGVAYLMLVAYLALFFGFATWLAVRLERRRRIPAVWSLPILWVALEFLRSFLFSGFPWASLGYSQQAQLTLLQSSDLFGVYGLSFLLILSNGALAHALTSWRRESRWRALAPLALALVLIAGDVGYGRWRQAQDLDAREKSLQVALIQGNIEQGLKWNPAYQEQTVERYLDLSLAAAVKVKPDLIIWPESATPFYFQEPGPLAERVRRLPSRTGAYLLFGSPAYERRNRSYTYLNSAFLLGPDGEILGRSDKVHLVPFGEYVPLGRFLPFIDKLVTGIGDFSPGTISPLPMNGDQLGVLVCYESIFPELSREWVRRGSDLLVNITNDAWFGRSSAPAQHLAMSRFRAIENRIWLARAANTGISALIAPSGRILDQIPIFEARYLTGRVGLGAAPTFYTAAGDVFPMLFLALSALGFIWSFRFRTDSQVGKGDARLG